MLLLLLVLFFNTQNINRALLDNERATAKLLFNLMKSELEKEKMHQLKWQERVKDWKLIQKNCVAQSFRSEILQSYFRLLITQSDSGSLVVSIKQEVKKLIFSLYISYMISCFHYKYLYSILQGIYGK